MISKIINEKERSLNKDNFLTGSKITMIVLRNFLKL